ncbi:hypothetical protein ACSQ67_025156 [Phaseolus vulgaris]
MNKPRDFANNKSREHAELARIVVDIESMNTRREIEVGLGQPRKMEAHVGKGQAKARIGGSESGLARDSFRVRARNWSKKGCGVPTKQLKAREDDIGLGASCRPETMKRQQVGFQNHSTPRQDERPVELGVSNTHPRCSVRLSIRSSRARNTSQFGQGTTSASLSTKILTIVIYKCATPNRRWNRLSFGRLVDE